MSDIGINSTILLEPRYYMRTFTTANKLAKTND